MDWQLSFEPFFGKSRCCLWIPTATYGSPFCPFVPVGAGMLVMGWRETVVVLLDVLLRDGGFEYMTFNPQWYKGSHNRNFVTVFHAIRKELRLQNGTNEERKKILFNKAE